MLESHTKKDQQAYGPIIQDKTPIGNGKTKRKSKQEETEIKHSDLPFSTTSSDDNQEMERKKEMRGTNLSNSTIRSTISNSFGTEFTHNLFSLLETLTLAIEDSQNRL